MARESFRDRALVLRSYDFGEADRIIVLLTRGHGVQRSVAKGVRRSRSRFGSRLQPFVELDVQLYPGRNLATLTGADTVSYYGSKIIDDFERYAAACAVLECAERLAVAELGADPYLFDATNRALSRLQQTPHAVAVVDGFIVQATAHSGWGLSLFDCAQCGKPGPHHAFHPGAGGAVCVSCRPPGSAEVPAEALHLLWLLLNDYGDAAMAMLASPGGAELGDAAHRLARAHVQWQLERKLVSLTALEEG